MRHPVCVIGGTSGIGSDIVRVLSASGHDILFTYNSSHDRASDLTAELSPALGNVSSEQLNLTDCETLDGFTERLIVLIKRLVRVLAC